MQRGISLASLVLSNPLQVGEIPHWQINSQGTVEEKEAELSQGEEGGRRGGSSARSQGAGLIEPEELVRLGWLDVRRVHINHGEPTALFL